MVSASDDKSLKLWLVSLTFTSHGNQVRTVAFVQAGQLIATVSSDNTVRMQVGSLFMPLKEFRSQVLGIPAWYSPEIVDGIFEFDSGWSHGRR